MPASSVLPILATLALLLGLLWLWQRRPPVAAPPLPQTLGKVLDSLPHRRLLDSAQRARHQAAVEQFLRDKRFVACAGLQLSEAMRVQIAGLACLLVLRPQARGFPLLREVLVYPGPFLVPQTEPDEDGLVYDEPVEHIGESWSEERVILSWPDVQAALAGSEVNVVVHEFAHQLDDESPEADGAPLLRDYARWAEVMEREYARLQRHRRPPVLDPYGAQNPAEFFAVVTEAYFQRGADLQQHHAELYGLLRDYYGLDTAALRFTESA